MKESYRENLASSSGLELYAGDGDIVGVASVRGDAGQPLSSEILTFACRPCTDRGKATSDAPKMARRVWTRRRKGPSQEKRPRGRSVPDPEPESWQMTRTPKRAR
jgi:hypothetical protein